MESKFWGSVIIILFAGSVALLGAHELHKRAQAHKQRIDMAEIVKELYGYTLYDTMISENALAFARERSVNRSKSSDGLVKKMKEAAAVIVADQPKE